MTSLSCPLLFDFSEHLHVILVFCPLWLECHSRILPHILLKNILHLGNKYIFSLCKKQPKSILLRDKHVDASSSRPKSHVWTFRPLQSSAWKASQESCPTHTRQRDAVTKDSDPLADVHSWTRHLFEASHWGPQSRPFRGTCPSYQEWGTLRTFFWTLTQSSGLFPPNPSPLSLPDLWVHKMLGASCSGLTSAHPHIGAGPPGPRLALLWERQSPGKLTSSPGQLLSQSLTPIWGSRFDGHLPCGLSGSSTLKTTNPALSNCARLLAYSL